MHTLKKKKILLLFFFPQELDGVDFGTACENHLDQEIKTEINESNLNNRMQDETYINAAFVPDRAANVLSTNL